MENQFQVFFQYEIKKTMFHHYKQELPYTLKKLKEFGAKNIQCRQSTTNPYEIVESFRLPTEAHYFSLKKMRQSKSHRVFGNLDCLIEGGLKEIECFAIKKTASTF
ncbi:MULTISPECIES: hypothetical protein [unclassified Bacillus (in: firmicutes)]|uniref:hypothetical protein n=1 Tax=unclassified Bacillus (in: firmicutes) TaxID=185979 RepID=UPI0008E52944|nr:MULTISPECIES: hypothetical protein [unclassified Bacillus (in: firmicutes)]SFB09990.1 hypothetical protein SAMN02799634_105316 [Bacillus sp. UNCCL13]SFQ86458.1 hypothetical protein SAMN04488577_2804 [Bacillus sp. cl95]